MLACRIFVFDRCPDRGVGGLFCSLVGAENEAQPVEIEEEVKKKRSIKLSFGCHRQCTDFGQIGYGLVEMVDEDAGGPLVNRITSIRKTFPKPLVL